MKFLLFTLLSALLGVFLNIVAPYWVIMIAVTLLAALIRPSVWGGFLGGGLGMGLVWLGQTVYISAVTSSALPDKMGALMGFGSGLSLMLLTAVLGFILGGCSGLLGVLSRNLIQKKPTDVYLG
ncbi:MAG: hypothetical protein O2829_06685 [Bacteroidetes bacterium]|nr:hypothetical protein [Bacteroidota bacterium]MDA1268763.1 hypothetical protein [Bacteroidota bacterium]